jgi:hypothetical protein
LGDRRLQSTDLKTGLAIVTKQVDTADIIVGLSNSQVSIGLTTSESSKFGNGVTIAGDLVATAVWIGVGLGEVEQGARGAALRRGQDRGSHIKSMILPKVRASNTQGVYAGQSSRDHDFGYDQACWSNYRTANLFETVRNTVRSTILNFADYKSTCSPRPRSYRD